MINKIIVSSSILFGIGKISKAPGTIGSFIAIIVLYFINYLVVLSSNTLIFASIVFIGFIYGVYSSSVAEKKYGHDASYIIIDEFFGQLSVFLFLAQIEIWQYILGFVLFRFFDIAKPIGINRIQKLPSGWGVMCDDMLAGFYTLILLHTITYFL